MREAYTKAGVFKPTLDFDARDVPGAELAEQPGKAPMTRQSGTTWEYNLSVDVQGRVVEAVSGQRLGDFLPSRLKLGDLIAANVPEIARTETQDTGQVIDETAKQLVPRGKAAGEPLCGGAYGEVRWACPAC